MVRGETLARYSLLIALVAATAVGLAQTRLSGRASGEFSAPGSALGNPSAGKAIFDGMGKCVSCHRVGASGSVVGPNLSDIGAQLTPVQLRQWLVSPPQATEPQNRLYEIVTRSGKTIRGKLLNQGPFSLQMLETSGQLAAFSRSQVREGHFVDPPAMPSCQGTLSSARIDDLIAYLASLRTPGNN